MADTETTTTEASEAPETTADAVSEAPSETEAPEADAPESKDEPAPQPSKLLAAVARKKAKLREEKAAFERSRAEFQAQQAQIQDQLRESQQLKQMLAQLREDPDSVADALGLSYDKWTARRLRQGTPEAQIDALREQIDAERKARAESEARARGQAAAKEFVGLIRTGEYPETSLYEDQEILEGAIAIEAALHKATGRWPEPAEIARELEARLAKNHARMKQRLGIAAPDDKKSAPKGATTTLTNKHAGEGTKRPPPRSRDEQAAHAAQALGDWFAESNDR